MADRTISYGDIPHLIVDYGGILLLTSISLSLIEFLIIGRVSSLPLLIGFLAPLPLILLSRRHRILEALFNSGVYRGSVKTLCVSMAFFILYVLFLYTPVWIFPGNPSGDFFIYVSTAQRFMSGDASIGDLMVMHPVIYPFLGTVLSLFNGMSDNPVLVSRLFMMLLSFYSIPLIYEISGRLYGRWAGEASVILSILINIFWYTVIIVTGLYANFLGIVSTLYLILLMIRFHESGRLILLPMLFIASSIALLAHESTFLFLIGVWLAALYSLIYRDLRLLKIALSISSPIILFLIFSLHDLNVIYIFLSEYVFRLKPFTVGATRMEAFDPFADFLYQYSPFLSSVYRYMRLAGLIVALATLVWGIYLVYKRADGLRLMPWFWFISIWIFTLFFLDIWRFSLYSMYPACILLGGINRWLGFFERALSRVSGDDVKRRIIKIEIVTLLILLIFASSPLLNMTKASIATRNYEYSKQMDIYASMIWLRENTPEDCVVISIGRWEFMYTQLIAGRPFYGDYFKYPDELYPSLQGFADTRDIYIVVWNRLMDLDNKIPMVEYYRNDTRYKAVYNNTEVTIFRALA